MNGRAPSVNAFQAKPAGLPRKGGQGGTKMTTTKPLLMLAAILALGSGTAAATDIDTMRSKVRKYGTAEATRPRTLCVCQDGSPNQGRVGLVWGPVGTDTYVSVICYVPQYDAVDGHFVAAFSCNTFVPLAK